MAPLQVLCDLFQFCGWREERDRLTFLRITPCALGRRSRSDHILRDGGRLASRRMRGIAHQWKRRGKVLDFYTIIFLALAVFIFARLRSVLGQRTGRERPPYDPYSARDAAKPVTGPDKVVTLPDKTGEASLVRKMQSSEPPADRWAGIAETGTPIAAGLDAIAKAEPDFDAHHFIAGAKSAYEMIVTAFAEGDRKTLKNLLAKDVFDGFAQSITERENRGETAESRFVALDKAEITHAELKGNTAQVTVRFVSQLISVTRNKAGEVISGSPESVTHVNDVWTFARDAGARDPNWKLVSTESA
jgi:predicted lipid-binding transport protein (Tim44 family)